MVLLPATGQGRILAVIRDCGKPCVTCDGSPLEQVNDWTDIDIFVDMGTNEFPYTKPARTNSAKTNAEAGPFSLGHLNIPASSTWPRSWG